MNAKDLFEAGYRAGFDHHYAERMDAPYFHGFWRGERDAARKRADTEAAWREFTQFKESHNNEPNR